MDHSIDEYLATLPEPTRKVLERVRGIIHKAVPDAEEVISYKMPTFKLHGRAIVHIAGWKEHWALYAASGHTVAALGDELAGYEVSKGTIRFPLDEPVPVKLITRIAKLRAAEESERALTKKTFKKR